MKDIPDLVSAGDPKIYGPAFILERINQRHRQRVAEITSQRDGAADEGLRLRGLLDTKADEIERLRADRDRILAQSNCYGAKIERLQPELDTAHQTIAKLQLDVGILNGRLIERTEAMLERQREEIQRTRQAGSTAREAIAKFEQLADGFRQTAADSTLSKRARGDSAAIARRLGEYADYLREKLEGGAR